MEVSEVNDRSKEYFQGTLQQRQSTVVEKKPKPKSAPTITPVKTNDVHDVQWVYDERVHYNPVASVSLSTGTVTNASLPITTATVIYPMFGFMSSDKHSRDVLHVDVLIPAHPAAAVTPRVHDSGRRIIVTYNLFNGLYNEKRISFKDAERQYTMRNDFRRAVKQLHNGGTTASVTQVIELPFVCEAEFYCEEEVKQGWRLVVETHPDQAMASIPVPEYYLCMQLLKLGEKKLKRMCPEICIKTTKKTVNKY